MMYLAYNFSISNDEITYYSLYLQFIIINNTK